MSKAISINFWNLTKLDSKVNVSKPKLDYLAGIAQNDTKVLKAIYKENLGKITKFVQKNNGSKDDALDVFQDALVVIYKKIQANELQLTSSFSTYLFSVCRFIWLRELKKKYRQEAPMENISSPCSSIDIEKEWCENEKRKLFQSKMKQLSTEAQQVLILFFNGHSMKEIASKMNYTLAYAQRKKYLAKNQLIELVKSDTRYRELR